MCFRVFTNTGPEQLNMNDESNQTTEIYRENKTDYY